MKNAQIITMEDYDNKIPDLPIIEGASFRGWEYENVELLEYVRNMANFLVMDFPKKTVKEESEEGGVETEESGIDEKKAAEEEKVINYDDLCKIYEVDKPEQAFIYLTNWTNVFAHRYHDSNNMVKEAAKKRYKECYPLLSALEGFKIDPVKFFYLIQFLHDYAKTSTTNVRKYGKSQYEDLVDIVNSIEKMEFIDENNKYGSVKSNKKGALSISISDKEDLKVSNPKTLYVIKEIIKYITNDITENSVLHLLSRDDAKEVTLDGTAKIAIFASALERFIGGKKSDTKIPAFHRNKFGIVSQSIYVAFGDKGYNDPKGTKWKNNRRTALSKLPERIDKTVNEVYYFDYSE